MRLNRLACVVALAVVSARSIQLLHAKEGDTSALARAQRVAGLSAADFPGHEYGASIQDVAIAPDSNAFVVNFAADEAGGKAGLFLGLWGLQDNKLSQKIRLADYKGMSYTARNVHTVAFSPDGAVIVVAYRATVFLIEAATLRLLHKIDLPPGAQPSKYPPFVREFSISRDSNTLAVLSGDGPYAPGVDLVRVFRVKTGDEIARWNPAEKLKSISISSSGDLLLAGTWDPRRPEDILLVEALTGKILQHFRSGFAYGQGYSNLSMAVFLEHNKFIAVPDHYSDSKGKYADRIEVMDSSTGMTLQDMTYDRFGPTGVLAISGDEKIIVSLNYPTKHAKGAQLLYYRSNEKTPFCVLDPVPTKEADGKNTGQIRFSLDPALFGIFTPERLGIYRVSNCNSTPAGSHNSD